MVSEFLKDLLPPFSSWSDENGWQFFCTSLFILLPFILPDFQSFYFVFSSISTKSSMHYIFLLLFLPDGIPPDCFCMYALCCSSRHLFCCRYYAWLKSVQFKLFWSISYIGNFSFFPLIFPSLPCYVNLNTSFGA